MRALAWGLAWVVAPLEPTRYAGDVAPRPAKKLRRGHVAGVLWRVRLPMLLAPVLTAFAVGFAVSVGQYRPTRWESILAAAFTSRAIASISAAKAGSPAI